MKLTVSTFYKFVRILDPAELQGDLTRFCEEHGLRGTVLIAGEGINATVSGRGEDVDRLLAWLRSDRRFADLVAKQSSSDGHPFKRLKVKVKSEIVTFGDDDGNPARGTGTYVAPEDWNALIRSPDVVVVDTRNSYECDIGSFKGALDPQTGSFREFPSFVKERLDPARDRKIAMFCTGGIRCEKATAYMRAQGFENVYHLEGGILKYLEVVPPEESLWEGECFIFDGRVALGHGVRTGSHVLCARCGYPIRRADEGAQDVCSRCLSRERREGPDDTHSGR